MEKKLHCFFMMLALLSGVHQVAAQGTAFTYNGKLNDGADPASGNYDLRFTLYDAGTNGNVFGSLTNTATAVSNGLFLVTLDFGGVFNGSNYWLEIAARTNGNSAFTTLSPRQQLTPTPYAIYAANAGSAATATTASSANSVSAANITGTVQLAQLPGVVLTNNQSGVVLSGIFSGGTSSTLPDIVVFPDGTAYANATKINTAGTMTCGIQEAINSFTNKFDGEHYPHGGTLLLAPGTFFTYTNITLPYSLNLYGSGVHASGITYVGTATQNVMTIGGRNSDTWTNMLDFRMRDMWMSSAINGLTNILYLDGRNGGIGKVDIQFCRFSPWQVMTNFAAYQAGATHRNLVAINIDSNYGDWINVSDCLFDFVNGIYLAADHATFNRNFFSHCGSNNEWSATNQFSLGASISCGDPVALPNGNKDWTFHDNYFLLCSAGYYIGTNTGSLPVSYNDAFESGGTLTGVLSGGNRWVLVNPRKHTPDLIHKFVSPTFVVGSRISGSVVSEVNLFGPLFYNNATVDADGVALAAIQGLNQKLEEKDARIAELERRLEKLERLMNHQNGGAK